MLQPQLLKMVRNSPEQQWLEFFQALKTELVPLVNDLFEIFNLMEAF